MGRACGTNTGRRRKCVGNAWEMRGKCVGNAWEMVGKPEGTRPLGRPRRTCMDNNEMDRRVIGGGDMDWIYLAQDGDW
jgi:hypothetical protein